MENKNKIEDFHDKRLDDLKLAAYKGNLVKGLRETLRAIKLRKAVNVYLADSDLSEKYSTVIMDFCKLYLLKYPIQIKDFTILRDIVMKRTPSDIIKLNASKYGEDTSGKKKQKGPKCYCAAIIEPKKILNEK